MAQDSSPAQRRPSLFFPILLIVIGAIFLYAEFRPNFDPWPLLRTYWPLILIFLGLAKIWDSARMRKNAGVPYEGPSAAGVIAAVVLVVVLIALFGHSRRWGRWNSGTVYAMQHLERSVNRDDAKNVDAKVELGAGDLDISGGSTHLLEADFNYRSSSGAPQIDYNISGTTGNLSISQDTSNAHFNTTSDNRWTLHFANDIPLDLRIDMGAGRGNFRFRDVDVTHLTMNMGAGQVDVDFTGERKSDLTADIEGGVGEANIRLPKNAGVLVSVSGGLGTVDTHGLKKDGDDYINDAYGKAGVPTIRLKVQGGIGRISLTQE
jgi:hypothetical protein